MDRSYNLILAIDLEQNLILTIKTKDMKRRKRMNARAICSSENYVASRKAHRLMLEINHLENEEFFIEVKQRVVIVNRPKVYTQVKIFGKWVNLDGRDYNSFIGFELK